MNLDELLNPRQKEAATYLDSHLRIIAGAGSGKTRVLTYRIAYLIEEVGIEPRHILAITFTNKAANEMKERVIHLLGDYASGALLCTIHSLCVRILRQNIRALNYPNNFIIMDEEDQKSLLKKIFKEREIDQKTISVKSCISYISTCKIAGVTPDRALSFAGDFIGEQKKAIAYQDYEQYKEDHFMLDFDDLLLKTVELFEKYPEILERWQRQFQFIHVDEFQDVSEVDYKLIKYLSGQSTLCVVGDPDQTIYSFRGSDINFIMNFDKDFPHTKTVILDQNYRSTKTILDISNNLIRKNKNRLEKDLFTELEDGPKVLHYSGVDEEAEANFVCDTIEDIIQKVDGVNYHDFAILYRANYLSRSFEQKLIQRQIDYKIFGGLKFFNRKEIKDALSYIRLMVNKDDLSFERIVNVPARGVGEKTLQKIQNKAIEYGISHYEALCLYNDEIGLSGKARKQLAEFVRCIESAKSSSLSLPNVFEKLLTDVGYFHMLKNDQDDNRIQNLMELKNSITNYMNTHPDTATFESYLQDIALYTSQDDVFDDEYVSLMSIHMAKGLEFNYVFVVGLSEDVFPSFRSISEAGDDGMEEERRLAYVAFTRAKKRLYLTDSQGFNFITNSPKMSSRFIDEIGSEHVEHKGNPSKFKPKEYLHLGPTVEEMIGDNEVEEWKQGDLVEHDTFGKGVIVKVNGTTLDIAFSVPYGIKTLMAHHKALRKLSS
ncbi:ATP-dependent helicase [Candidatus Stoquefichus massiliensis]|uniref:ATP-dependent helicase n=1 Tax=Candidatus Stoquefichus massiliensis TaxID=1470350 RepID=UPI00047F4F61|nr:ATP-dependent helicase [Candidatus Stoquefichus massiliensis]